MQKFLKKYFNDGQNLSSKGSNSDDEETINHVDDPNSWDKVFLRNHRKLIGVMIPIIFFWVCWWCLAIRYDYFQYFPVKYFMTILTVFSSFIAGATSEGGGAVAFPVLTLGFSIEPSVARDVSFMIQSCGMTAAAFTIIFMRVRVEWRSIIFCSLGAVFGVIFSLHFIDPHLNAAQKKIGFVSVWFPFAIALYLLNREKKRRTFDEIPELKAWKIAILFGVGIFGGIFTGVAGSGVDICSFSVLTLLFNVSEKVATPTSVILMAINTCIGFAWRQLMMNDVSADAWEYLAVSVPTVVIFAPIGSLFASHVHRLVLAWLVYILEIVSLIGGYSIVRPDWPLALAGVTIILLGLAWFYAISVLGKKLTNSILKENLESNEKASSGKLMEVACDDVEACDEKQET